MPVLSDSDGVPILPEGFVGSIAHKHGRAVAVVARSRAAAGIGIDLEFATGADSKLENVVSPSEAPALTALSASEEGLSSSVTVVFAAKEALYKAVFPTCRTRFDFDDVELAFTPEARHFRAVSFPGDEQLGVTGHYALGSGWVVALARAARRP